MNIETRHSIEKQIAIAAAQGLIDAGYSVAVYDGEEIAQEDTTDINKIKDALFATDEDHLMAYKDGSLRGSVSLIYGNDGWDVMADYSTSLEPALLAANELADKLEKQYG